MLALHTASTQDTPDPPGPRTEQTEAGNALDPEFQRASQLVRTFLGTVDPTERARLLGEAERIPYELVRQAVTSLAAHPDAPRTPGTAHHREVAVGVAGAPPAPYLIHLPHDYDSTGAAPSPVLLAMHHTGGEAAHMDGYWSAACDQLGVILVCPQATVNRHKGWGSTEIEIASIRAVLRDVLLNFACDPDRVAFTGMSMGGHASWEMALRYPDLAAAIFPECGGPRKECVPMIGNLAGDPVGGTLVWQCQGARDQPELVRAVRMGIERLEKAGGRVVYEEDPEKGHEYFPEARLPRLEALRSTARPPAGDELEFVTSATTGARFRWLRVEETGTDCYQLGDPIQLVFRGGEAPTEEQKFFKLWSEIGKRLARVKARIDGNKILLTEVAEVKRLSFLIESERFRDFELILVKRGGKTLWKGPPRPSARTLLEELDLNGDRRRLVDQRITIDVGRR